MSRKYFGTDGVRGTVGTVPITPDFVLRLGYAAGKVLARGRAGDARRTVLIGKDTRISGYMLESSLEAGFCAAGIDVLLVGPQGQAVVLLSDVGGANDVTNLTLTLDDDAAGSLPDEAPLTDGSWRPTNFETDAALPA